MQVVRRLVTLPSMNEPHTEPGWELMRCNLKQDRQYTWLGLQRESGIQAVCLDANRCLAVLSSLGHCELNSVRVCRQARWRGRDARSNLDPRPPVSIPSLTKIFQRSRRFRLHGGLTGRAPLIRSKNVPL